jgi:hypothetical protein
MRDEVFMPEYEERRRDHDVLTMLTAKVAELCVDTAEIKSLLMLQNGRIRKLEERWWLAMGALLAVSTAVNWGLFEVLLRR